MKPHKKARKTRPAPKTARRRPAPRAGVRRKVLASAHAESEQKPKVTFIEEQTPVKMQAAPESTSVAPESMLQLYLREIGQVKLLTPQEEIQLARRIQQGDEQAREHMIKANLRLVVKIAREYENLGLPLLDLINEGNMGLMKGVERFDPKKGAKLSTYASWWIKQSIKRALANQSKTIRLPVHVVDKVADIRRAEMKLKEKLDREPTDEELAEMLDLKPQRVREYREAARAPVSLDAPLGHDDDSDYISEVVADTRAEAPYANLSKDTDKALLKEVFATLSPREQHILTLRFGLQDDAPKTLEEIGQQYRLTRERIRQIESEGLQKLRARMAKRDSLALEGVFALSE